VGALEAGLSHGSPLLPTQRLLEFDRHRYLKNRNPTALVSVTDCPIEALHRAFFKYYNDGEDPEDTQRHGRQGTRDVRRGKAIEKMGSRIAKMDIMKITFPSSSNSSLQIIIERHRNSCDLEFDMHLCSIPKNIPASVPCYSCLLSS
jgi:hypothetical protein